MGYHHITVEIRHGVGWLLLDRSEKLNALSADMWADIPDAVAELSSDDDVRSVVVAGRGPAFTVGIDLEMLMSLQPEGRSQTEIKLAVYRDVKRLQATMTALAECPKPVIAAVHGYC
ncbi:MAG: enoyl-CoA hydratase-related protein, partial [Acidimicrobiia bacterium]